MDGHKAAVNSALGIQRRKSASQVGNNIYKRHNILEKAHNLGLGEEKGILGDQSSKNQNLLGNDR